MCVTQKLVVVVVLLLLLVLLLGVVLLMLLLVVVVVVVVLLLCRRLEQRWQHGGVESSVSNLLLRERPPLPIRRLLCLVQVDAQQR